MMIVCCVCDIKLESANSTGVSLYFLNKQKWMHAQSDDQVLSKICRDEYCISGKSYLNLSPAHSVLLSRLCVSPRSTVFVIRKIPYLSICKMCKNARAMPQTAIKSMPIGNEPSVLAVLNAAELALVSRGKVFTHLFHIFGGSQKPIRTYHHFQTDLHCQLCCILSGPFTPEQKILAIRSVQVDPTKVIVALSWLKANNVLYTDVDIPKAADIVLPVLVDIAYSVDSMEEAVERTHTRTVCYSRKWNGVIRNQEVPLNNTATPNTRRLTDVAIKQWTNCEFVKSFPRQFPFGTGGKPYNMSLKKYAAHLRALSNESYRNDPLFFAVLRSINKG